MFSEFSLQIHSLIFKYTVVYFLITNKNQIIFYDIPFSPMIIFCLNTIIQKIILQIMKFVSFYFEKDE